MQDEIRTWAERHDIELVMTDLPSGIAAQYYVGLRQLVVADDLDEFGWRQARADIAHRITTPARLA